MKIVQIGGKFIKEGYPYSSDRGLQYVDDITDATKYHSIYEFMCSMHCNERRDTNIPIKWGKYDFSEFDIIKLIDTKTLEIEEYPIDFKVDPDNIPRELYVSREDFELLKSCWYQSNRFCYADDNWVPFPDRNKKEEYKSINMIRYTLTGLTSIMTIFNYRNSGLPSCYEYFFKDRLSLLNDTIYKIVLADFSNDDDDFIIRVEDK